MYIVKKDFLHRSIYKLLSIPFYVGLILAFMMVDTALAQEATSLPQEEASISLSPIPPIAIPRLGPNVDQHENILSTAFIPNLANYPLDFVPPTETGRWIRVILSQQVVLAYQGYEPVRGFVISSGKPETPTVTGNFTMLSKVRIQDMTGNIGTPEVYWIPDVEWVQYFYDDYAFHASTHNHFGETFSNGCINMAPQDAKWLFDYTGPFSNGDVNWLMSHWSNPGTEVVVHE